VSDRTDLPFPTSECHGCVFVKLSGNARGSVFMMCTEPSLPKYLPQPVRGCPRRIARAR
jgi:hypothetical protein